MPVEGRRRPAWAEVDLTALAHNAASLAALVAPATLCAVVKADGYGHGARTVARALLEGGASTLGVALVDEGIELREDGVTAPVLLLAEAPSTALRDAIAARLTLTIGSVRAAHDVVAAGGAQGPPVHVKLDTGMHRQGAAPGDLPAVLAVLASGGVAVGGLWTHLPVADGDSEEARSFTLGQLATFEAALDAVRHRLHRDVVRHAANTAGALWFPAARLDLVRAGLGVYGCYPHPAMGRVLEDAGHPPLRPVLSVKARVVAVRDLPAGARPSYGRRRALARDARVATVPVGYADGYPRAMLDGGAEVLIRGRRRPLAGVVTMDQLLVECDDDVEVGDEVVLLGRQGADEVSADEWARALGTISWEVLCGIKPRIPKLAVE
ncbi:MAG TPA: alanine racemase [Acidimicrobiales bacterium]|nr:alanine racemase [Acidimicrobiales bacterium]